jgi:hypothetical protein
MSDSSYFEFTGKARLDRSINSLLGIIEGISIDGILNNDEMKFLARWIKDHQEKAERHPYNEILPLLAKSIDDGILDEEERADLKYACENLLSTDYYDEVAAEMQILHEILAGIAVDGVITKNELEGLSVWLADHEFLRKCWPYDEIDSLIVSVLADQHIDDEEHKALLSYFSEFTNAVSNNSESPLIEPLAGICAVAPEINFDGSVFCFTGESVRLPRKELSNLVIEHGGKTVKGVSKILDYLVVGAAGNPCWKYSCYGRKIELAMNYRKQGFPILLIHENDFFDALN